MELRTETIELSSSHSTQISLTSIREGEAGLNSHRMSMLNRVPEIGDFASFRHESIFMIDLAYLTACTGHEFAILRGKDVDILFHGDARRCEFPETIVELMLEHKLEIYGHSHPGEDDPVPSPGDRIALKRIGQKKSTVISGRTGRIKVFSQNPFDE